MRKRRRSRGLRAPPGILLRLLPLAFTIGACQMVGEGRTTIPTPVEAGPAPPGPEGTYGGHLNIDGGEVPASLTLIREGSGKLLGFLELPSELEAQGEGEVSGRSFRLELSYGGECPGRMVLVGRWEPGAEILTGVVRASDCTGKAEGSFRLSAHHPQPLPRNPWASPAQKSVTAPPQSGREGRGGARAAQGTPAMGGEIRPRRPAGR